MTQKHEDTSAQGQPRGASAPRAGGAPRPPGAPPAPRAPLPLCPLLAPTRNGRPDSSGPAAPPRPSPECPVGNPVPGVRPRWPGPFRAAASPDLLPLTHSWRLGLVLIPPPRAASQQVRSERMRPIRKFSDDADDRPPQSSGRHRPGPRRTIPRAPCATTSETHPASRHQLTADCMPDSDESCRDITCDPPKISRGKE